MGLSGTPAFVAPPVLGDDALTAQIYIWGSHLREERKTSPRVSSAPSPGQSGQKERNYTMHVWVSFADNSDNPLADSVFPVLLDAIQSRLRSTAMPVQITDGVTQESSQVVAVGEEQELEYSTPHALSDQRYWRYTALITCTIKEWIQS